MSTPVYLSARNFVYHDYPVGGVPGATCLCDLELRGTANLALLNAAAESLWQEHTLPVPVQVWFRRAVREQGDPDLASWFTALTVAFQWLTGDPVGFGRVLEVKGTLFTVAIPYERREVLEEALGYAQRFLTLWLSVPAPTGEECAVLLDEFGRWLKRVPAAQLTTVAQRLVLAARSRQVPVEYTGNDALQFGWGQERRLVAQVTQSGGVRAMTGILEAWSLLKQGGFPVIDLYVAKTAQALIDAVRRNPEPYHVAPQGAGLIEWTAAPIKGAEAMQRRLAATQPNSGPIHYFGIPAGSVHHLLFVDYQLVSVTRLDYFWHGGVQKYGYSPVLKQVPQEVRRYYERVARYTNEAIVCLTVHVPDIARLPDPLLGNPGVFSDCMTPNRLPPYLFGMFSTDTAWLLVSRLMQGRRMRLPSTFVAGAFGAASASKFLASIWQAAEFVPGVVTSQGMQVGTFQVRGPQEDTVEQLAAVLRQPEVGAVVYEPASSGFLASGNPCGRFDVGVLMNILSGEILSKSKGQQEAAIELRRKLLDEASEAVVINAEDAACLAIGRKHNCRRQLWVGLSGPEHAEIQAHLAQGGEAVVVEQHDSRTWIVLMHAKSRTRIVALEDIPATGAGAVRSVVEQAVFAAAAALAHDLGIDTIRKGLIACHLDD